MKTLTIFVIALASLLAGGCLPKRVIPPPIHDEGAAFDEGERNSGFIGFTNGVGVITTRGRERYNNLVWKYGKKFNPRIRFDDGISPAEFTVPPYDRLYLIDKEHLTKFLTMHRWLKENR